MREQIEHYFDGTKRGGEKRKSAYRKANKREKILQERRQGKEFVEETSIEFSGDEENEYEEYTEIAPKHSPTYRKYEGWEY